MTWGPSMTLQKFSRKTIEAIRYYVYGLKKSGSRDYFYIGKGKGNRVFSHINQKIKKGILDPKFELIQSLKDQGGVEIDIIRHGLSEHEALLIESTLIDALGVFQLTNKVRGVDSNQFGLMPPESLDQQYKGLPFNRNIKAVCFKINKRWRKNMSPQELYDSVRGSWRVDIGRAKNADFGIGVRDGVIRAIYSIHFWETVPDREPVRYRFQGMSSVNMQKYLGYTLNHIKAHDVRGPFFYLNC